MKDYDILYHPGKANVVADALGRRGPGQLHSMRPMAKEIAEDMVRSEIELVVGRFARLLFSENSKDTGKQQLERAFSAAKAEMLLNAQLNCEPERYLPRDGEIVLATPIPGVPADDDLTVRAARLITQAVERVLANPAHRTADLGGSMSTRQMADAIWWVKTYQKDKDHLIVMKMAMLVKSRTDIGIDPEEKALRFFDCLLSSWSGQVLDAEDQAFLDSAMRAEGHNMASLRADAVRRSIKELEVIDRLIERQFKNMRLLMQSYESVRFAPQLLKKMDLEIRQLEQGIEKTIEDQRREVSRQ